jgi:hypothetical protein
MAAFAKSRQHRANVELIAHGPVARNSRGGPTLEYVRERVEKKRALAFRRYLGPEM